MPDAPWLLANGIHIEIKHSESNSCATPYSKIQGIRFWQKNWEGVGAHIVTRLFPAIESAGLKIELGRLELCYSREKLAASFSRKEELGVNSTP